MTPPPFKNAAERNSHLMKEEDLDPQSSAAAGFYSGLIGAGLSLIGVLLSVYSLVAGEKSFWLGLSGWLAAILLAVTLTNLCVKLIKINAKLSSQLTVVKSKSVLLEEKNDRLSETNAKLVEIDAYITSQALRKPVPRRERGDSAPAQIPSQANNDPEEKV